MDTPKLPDGPVPALSKPELPRMPRISVPAVKKIGVILITLSVIAASVYAGIRLGSDMDSNTPRIQPADTPPVSAAPTSRIATLTPTPHATPVPTLSVITGWKPYTNTAFGYSIKYPQGLNLARIICEGELDMFYMAKGVESDSAQPVNCARDSRFNLEIVAADNPFVANDMYAVITKLTSVASVSATKKTFTRKPETEGPGEDWYTEVNFTKNGRYFNAYTRNRELEPVLDQILATFSFTE